MTLNLHTFKFKAKKKKCLGRGNSSGHGTYSTRGQKGQRARSGGRKGLKLKGMKKTILSSPKFKGMKPRFAKNQIVKLSQLDKYFEVNSDITPAVLLEKKLIDNLELPIKILFDVAIAKALNISGMKASAKVQELITKAGGKFEDKQS